MNITINHTNLLSQIFLWNRRLSHGNVVSGKNGMAAGKCGVQYRISSYYYNEEGVPFFSKEQADRCINGKDWKKIVSVSDKVKSDLAEVVKQDFISSNGAYIPEGTKRNDVINQYLSTISSKQRNSASWTLSRMAGDYASRMEALVKQNNPNWKPGDAFDSSILDELDGTLGELDFKA